MPKLSKFDITIDQVIRDDRKPPLSRADYRIYLESRYCEENLDFLVDVQSWVSGNGVRPESVTIDFSESSKSNEPPESVDVSHLPDAAKDARWIVRTFIEESSPKQVNISSDYRRSLERKVSEFRQPEADPDLFEDAYQEIRSLLLRDAWDAWVLEQTSMNIDGKERDNRFIVSALALLVSIVLWLTLWLTDTDRSPFYRVLTLIPNFTAAAFFWSAKTGVCSGLAKKDKRMPRDPKINKGWLAAFLDRQTPEGEYCVLRQEDPLISANIKRISTMNGVRSSVTAITLTVAMVVIHHW